MVSGRELTQLQDTGQCWFSRPVTIADLIEVVEQLGVTPDKLRVLAGGSVIGLKKEE
jgi:hypothetical protein